MDKSIFSTYKLAEIGKIITGSTPSSKKPDFFGTEYPFITPSDMTNSDRFIETERYLSDAGRENQKNRFLPKYTVCFVCIGATIGKVCMTKRPSFVNQQINCIIPNKQISDVKFVYYLMTTYGERVKSMAGGAATPIVNKSAFSEMDVSLPPITIQRKIAAVLSVYDDLIENNAKRIKILEETARALYREWFVDFRFPGHEKVKMVDSPLGKIPEGWEVAIISNLCKKITDGTHDTPKPVEVGYYLVTGKNLNSGFVDFTKCYCISIEDHKKVMDRSRPEYNDIIFSNIGTLGLTHLVKENFEFSIKNVALFKPLNLFSNFLYLYLSDNHTLKHLKSRASGTSQKFFSLDFLRSILVIKPSEEHLKRFNECVDALLDQRHVLHVKNTTLRQTRDLLLPKLISGEVDVSAMDIAEG